MPSAQGFLRIDKKLQGEPHTIYLTLAHMRCRTKRTFIIEETLNAFLDGKADGFFALARCPECDTVVMVHIFRGKKLDRGWSYGIPLQTATHIVKDDSELEKEKQK